MSEKSVPIKELVYTALFVALIASGATFLKIPMPDPSPPIVLANFFVVLCGLTLGPWWGLAAVGVYLGLGAIGLPLFAGKISSGLGVFAGPTGGYLVGYLLSVVIAGLISGGAILSEKRKSMFWIRVVLGSVLGFLAVHVTGVPWLAYKLNKSLSDALAIGLLPYIAPDMLKAALAASLTPLLRRLVA